MFAFFFLFSLSGMPSWAWTELSSLICNVEFSVHTFHHGLSLFISGNFAQRISAEHVPDSYHKGKRQVCPLTVENSKLPWIILAPSVMFGTLTQGMTGILETEYSLNVKMEDIAR